MPVYTPHGVSPYLQKILCASSISVNLIARSEHLRFCLLDEHEPKSPPYLSLISFLCYGRIKMLCPAMASMAGQET